MANENTIVLSPTNRRLMRADPSGNLSMSSPFFDPCCQGPPCVNQLPSISEQFVLTVSGATFCGLVRCGCGGTGLVVERSGDMNGVFLLSQANRFGYSAWYSQDFGTGRDVSQIFGADEDQTCAQSSFPTGLPSVDVFYEVVFSLEPALRGTLRIQGVNASGNPTFTQAFPLSIIYTFTCISGSFQAVQSLYGVATAAQCTDTCVSPTAPSDAETQLEAIRDGTQASLARA